MTDIFQITIILVASLLATGLSKRLGIPAVVGQMLVGLLLAPGLLGLVHGGHTIEIFSEIGVILLMFLAGLESDLGLLRQHLKVSLLVAAAGVLVPLLVFWLTAQLLGLGNLTSLFYGIVFAATSVSITIEVLQEFGQLQSRAGSIILGAAVVDDILTVFLLSIFSSVQTSGGNLILRFSLELLFFAFLFLVHKLIPRLWKLVGRLPIYAKNTSVALILCLALSLLASAVGMSAVIGAFFAGLAVAQTPVSQKIEEYSSAIAYVVFIPVFFVSIGLAVSFDSLLKQPLLIIGFSLLAILTKFLPAFIVGRWSHLSTAESALVGTGMISRGEMALIVAQLGLVSHFVTETQYSELILVILLVTLAAPFLTKLSLRLTN